MGTSTRDKIMGNNWVREFRDGTAQSPDSVTPHQGSQPTFDPNMGFTNGRVPRVLNVSAEEMEALQLSPSEKNYCADLHMKARICHYMNMPFGYKCNHIRHEVDHCLREDYIIRMKEYERERSLRKRAKRIAAQAGAEEMEE